MSHAAVTVLPLCNVPKAEDENVWTVVVAGGSGTRFGAAKQYEMIGGRRMLELSVHAAQRHSSGVVVVLPAADVDREQGIGSAVVAGGASRSESVRAGLAAVPATATVICVHDAARPFASDALFDAVIAAVSAGADGAIPGVPVTDTIKVIDADRAVVDTPHRDRLVAVQTPQAFRASVLRHAHAVGGDGTDDAALVEVAGGRVVVVPGEADNRKITHLDDLAWARAKVSGS
jgi:2-C-methyl-D-erythritol 4-phosphate cytidylyltransferase